MKSKDRLSVVCIHWGFLPGGVAKYAAMLEEMAQTAPIALKSIFTYSPSWHFDQASFGFIKQAEIVTIKSRRDFSWIFKIRKILKTEAPDLMFCHGFNGCFVAKMCALGLSIPIVASWHGDYHATTAGQKILAPFTRLLVLLLYGFCVRRVITVSEFARSRLRRHFIDAAKISVVHNGIPAKIDLSHCTSARDIRKELGVAEGGYLVGTACRMDKQKGLYHLVQGAAEIVKNKKTIKVVIWGDGALKKDLERFAAELGVAKQVLFPGYRPDIDCCLQALDIFVMTSVAEYFSIALLEAMRAGLPIVATAVGGNPEAIENGKHGVLIPYGDSSAIAQAVTRLIEDQDLRKKYAANAQQRFLKRFTADKMVVATAQWLMEP